MKNFLTFLLIAIIAFHAKSQDLNIELYEYIKNSPDNDDDEAVIAYLQKGGKTPKEKVELIAYWIMENISYDIEAFTSGSYQSSSWDVTFYSKKAVCAGYANLFKEFCNQLNIECIVVSGYAKGYGYDPNEHFTKSNHAWNIVIIDKEHYLFDVTWASGYASEIEGKMKYFKYPESNYLFSSPEYFVEKHLPSQRWWQLLENPVSLEQFEKLSSYEKMKRVEIPFYNYKDSIEEYLNYSFIERRIKDVEENMIVYPEDEGIPIDFEHIGYAYLQNTANLEYLQASIHYYEIAKRLYTKADDKNRCIQNIEYVDYYLDQLNIN